MAGIYIHIPFCNTKCGYCNFFSLASQKEKPDYHELIIKEMLLQKSFLNGQKIETVYFGGGTPSILDSFQIKNILQSLHQNFSLIPHPEITLEANPDHCTPGKLMDWKLAGINRLSIGVQSFRQIDLDYLQRIHSAENVIQSIQDARKNGFDSLSIDLIYGIPGLSDEAWTENLYTAVKLGVEHISAYALTVEDKTPLSHWISKGQMSAPEEDVVANHFKILQTFLPIHGYEHYEISNLSLPGKHALHNTAYWKGNHYLGLGPSAHSFNGEARSWNISSLRNYRAAIEKGLVPAETEQLSIQSKYNEYLMTGLRTSLGISLEIIHSNFGSEYLEYFSSMAKRNIEQGILILQNEKVNIHPGHWIQSDGIIAGLMKID